MTAEDVTTVTEIRGESTGRAMIEIVETETTTDGIEDTTGGTTVGTETTETTAEEAIDGEAETEIEIEMTTAAGVPTEVSKCSVQAMRTDHQLQKEQSPFLKESASAQAGISRLLALRTSQLLKLR